MLVEFEFGVPSPKIVMMNSTDGSLGAAKSSGSGGFNYPPNTNSSMRLPIGEATLFRQTITNSPDNSP